MASKQAVAALVSRPVRFEVGLPLIPHSFRPGLRPYLFQARSGQGYVLTASFSHSKYRRMNERLRINRNRCLTASPAEAARRRPAHRRHAQLAAYDRRLRTLPFCAEEQGYRR